MYFWLTIWGVLLYSFHMRVLNDSFLSHCASGRGISADDAMEILPVLSENPGVIMAGAGLVGAQSGPRAFTCGIVNAKSGHCGEDCAFCAQSSHYATRVSVHPLVSISSLYSHAEYLASHNITYMGMVTSGTAPGVADFDVLCEAASRIVADIPIKLCASLGLLTVNQAVALKEAGFSSYHHNLETSESFYPKICRTHSIEVRLKTIRNALEAGLRVCAGGLFGLGESWTDRIELSHTLGELGVHSIPVNFLMPISGTPLEKRALLSPVEGLTIIALLRLMHPSRDIVLCGGSSQILQQLKPCFYQAGANGLMVGNYLTTKGNPLLKDLAMLRQLEIYPCRNRT